MKIKCNKQDECNFSRCMKYGKCPSDEEYYCDDKCEFNTNNIEFEYYDGNVIYVSDLDNIKVCSYASIYNYLKCGMVELGKDCSECRFYINNIKRLS